MLTVFRAAAQQMTPDELLDIRLALIRGNEHPLCIEAVDRELRRRIKNPALSSTATSHVR
jgi:hypothetical protein